MVLEFSHSYVVVLDCRHVGFFDCDGLHIFDMVETGLVVGMDGRVVGWTYSCQQQGVDVVVMNLNLNRRFAEVIWQVTFVYLDHESMIEHFHIHRSSKPVVEVLISVVFVNDTDVASGWKNMMISYISEYMNGIFYIK